MKKRRKIFQRVGALLCCILLLPSLVAVPASAEDMSNFMDLVDAGYFKTIYRLSPTDNKIEFSFGEYTLLKYIDFVFSRSSTTPSRVFLVSDYDGSKQQLWYTAIGNNMYRAYNKLTIHSSISYHLEFETTDTTFIYPYSCKISLNTGTSFPEVGYIIASDYNSSQIYRHMILPETPLEWDFWYPDSLDNSYTCQYVTHFGFESWVKYDYLDVYLILSDANISSISCYIDSTKAYVPFDISVIGDVELFQYDVHETGGVIRYFPEGLDSCIHVNMRIDLTELYRIADSALTITVNGQYSTDVSYITLYSVNGYVSKEVSDTDTLWIKLKNFLTELFGKDDPVAEQAQQTQDQVDQEVNIQISQAMADWEANIEYAETGFTSGLTLVTPSVAWISLLATRIFESMGDFGAVYIMVGFMSVTMLLLSKSGVAAKIANNIRHSSGGKK